MRERDRHPRLVAAVLCSVMSNSATPWTVAHQPPLSMGFSRQEYWSGLLFLSPKDLPNPEIEPASPASPALVGGFFTTEPPGKSLRLVGGLFNKLGPQREKLSDLLSVMCKFSSQCCELSYCPVGSLYYRLFIFSTHLIPPYLCLASLGLKPLR